MYINCVILLCSISCLKTCNLTFECRVRYCIYIDIPLYTCMYVYMCVCVCVCVRVRVRVRALFYILVYQES